MPHAEITDIAPVLAGAAAGGLLLTMMGAAVAHAKRGEDPMFVPPAGLGLIAAYVGYSHLI